MRIFFLIFYFTVVMIGKALPPDSIIVTLGDKNQRKETKQVKSNIGVISFGQESITQKIYVRVNLGFDSSYTELNCDDKNWKTMFYDGEADKELNGKREFTIRLYYKFLPQSTFSSFIVDLQHIGASSIFLDGQIIKKNGLPSNKLENEKCIVFDNEPITIEKTNDSLHVIVIHFSNLKLRETSSMNPYPLIELSTVDDFIETESEKNAFLYFLSGIGAFFIALACIHFFLFITYRENKFNLYYFLFLAPLGLVCIILIIFMYIEDPGLYTFLERFYSFMVPLALCSLTILVYNLFKLKYNWYFYLMMVVYFSFFFFNLLQIHEARIFCDVVIFLFGYFGLTIIAVVSVFKKRHGANYLGLGIIGFTFFLITACVLTSLYKSPSIGLFFLGLSVLSIPLFMSAFLSKEFALINKSLKDQLRNNAELAEKTIQQEKEKKELLENQNIILEQQVQERTQEIVVQKQELQLKNQEITDSILYSKHIQEALLPDFINMDEVLKNYFILYKPKDIVSGDFYWFKKINENECLVAIADCTGHGVPGALMSLISIEQLEKAYLKFQTPSEILEEVNNTIRLTLKQNDLNSAKDGMDIALFKVSYNQNQTTLINYSGANRPCYIIKMDASLEEIKATKVSIGGHTPVNQKFESHEILLHKGEGVYFFTDGYADQFGSSKNKKLTTKRFKELLISLNGKTANEQKKQLFSFFEDWKSGHEQIDDVLVFGLLHH